jgi:xanthine dehydrogenase YagT iron-sulfur-binding subunit
VRPVFAKHFVTIALRLSVHATVKEPFMETTTADSGSADPTPIPITLHINGDAHALPVAPYVTLLDLLREQLQLSGTKKGCDHGQCGACTVLIDGKAINSCLKLAVTLDGAQVTTIEGLAQAGELDALQKAFIEHDAFQCGYCTPGQICSAKALVDQGLPRTRDEVREWMSGNLCRCGAYTNITDAVMEVLEQRAGARP